MKCFATTNSVQITPQGNLQPCCKFKNSLGSIEQLDDYFELPGLADLQTAHDQGEWTRNCSSCQRSEARGLQSRRELYNIIGLGAEDFFLDVSMGNYCNLKCRMCGPENSTKWKADHDKLVKLGLVEPVDVKNFMLSETDVKNIVDIVRAQTGRVVIEIKGGEPLLMPISKHFFIALSECTNSINFEIWLTTNLTLVPDWFIEVATQFKRIELNVSVDGTDLTYDYIRGPHANSQMIFNHADYLGLLKPFELRFNIVVQNLNVENLSYLYDSCFRRVGDEKFITLIPLQEPAYYRPNVYPDKDKTLMVSEWSKSNMTGHRDFESIVDYFMEPCDPDLYRRFHQITDALDKIRGQDKCFAIIAR